MGSRRRLWICDPRCSVWEGCHPGDYSCVTPGARCVRRVTFETGRVTTGAWSGGGGGNYTGECGQVTPGTRPGRRGHPGGSGPVTPGSGSWRGLTLGNMEVCSQVQGQGGCQPGNCRYLTPGTGSGRAVTLETVDM